MSSASSFRRSVAVSVMLSAAVMAASPDAHAVDEYPQAQPYVMTDTRLFSGQRLVSSQAIDFSMAGQSINFPTMPNAWGDQCKYITVYVDAQGSTDTKKCFELVTWAHFHDYVDTRIWAMVSSGVYDSLNDDGNGFGGINSYTSKARIWIEANTSMYTQYGYPIRIATYSAYNNSQTFSYSLTELPYDRTTCVTMPGSVAIVDSDGVTFKDAQ